MADKNRINFWILFGLLNLRVNFVLARELQQEGRTLKEIKASTASYILHLNPRSIRTTSNVLRKFQISKQSNAMKAILTKFGKFGKDSHSKSKNLKSTSMVSRVFKVANHTTVNETITPNTQNIPLSSSPISPSSSPSSTSSSSPSPSQLPLLPTKTSSGIRFLSKINSKATSPSASKKKSLPSPPLSPPPAPAKSPKPSKANSTFTLDEVAPSPSEASTPEPSPQGPSCSGMCCSNRSPSIPSGVAQMPSMWWSGLMADGAKIQIRSRNWNKWWIASGSSIKAYNSTPPSPTDVFTVIRISDNQVKFRTPAGRYIRAPTKTPVGFTVMDTVVNMNDPGTVFTVNYSGDVYSSRVFLQAFDGLYVAQPIKTDNLVRWAANPPSTWETFDIREVMMVPAVRGVNIGSWLVTENWMVPDMYANMLPLNDGTRVRFRSKFAKAWLTSSKSKNLQIINLKMGNSPLTDAEEFRIRREVKGEGKFQFRVNDSAFWNLDIQSKQIYANVYSTDFGGNADFNLTFCPFNQSLVVIQTSNGMFLRAWSDGKVTADVSPQRIAISNNSTWNGPSAFELVIGDTHNSEWNLLNELGSDQAQTTMDEHHDTFFTEADWMYLSNEAINAVRIPIGFWIAEDSNNAEPNPYIRNEAKYLDWAFDMGAKYNVRVWISMHGIHGAQNRYSHTASRDAVVEWIREAHFNKSLDTIRWVSERYANHPAWFGIGLVNEPVKSDVSLAFLQNYYLQAYDIIRTYSPCVYVATEWRIGGNPWEDVHWLMKDDKFTNAVMEAHSYQVFGGIDADTPAEEIDFIKKQKLKDIQNLQLYGRMLLIGEFSNAMKTMPTPEQQIAYSTAQIQTFGSAQAGWFFWALKLNRTGYDHWNFYKSRQNGWLPKKADGNWW